jgi:hypothetical protein
MPPVRTMQPRNVVSGRAERGGTRTRRDQKCQWSLADCDLVNSPYRASSSPRPDVGHACSCCLRPWSECVDALRSDGRNRQRTCPPCHDHGPNMLEASRVHAELWRTLARSRQMERDVREAQLKNRIAQLEQELHDRPTRTVERWVDQDQLKEAKEEADRAFRSRENAWQALCLVRLIHREGQPGQCRCGLRLDRCETAKIVDHYPGLEKWEKEQVRRQRDGLTHNLPDGHPALLDRRWQP